MALLSVSSSHHAIHPGSSRSMQCICTRVTPSRSVGEISRSRSRNDLPLGVSPSSRMLTTCTLKTPSYGNKSKSKEKINPRDMFTFSYRFNTDIPMTETPGASIDEYLQNRPRIVGAVFPDKRKRTKLSDEEWSVQLLPIQFLFLSASPVIVMRFVSKSGGKEYPPHVPVKATSLLLMEVTDYKLDGLDSNAMPSHLALTVRGSLYPRPEGRKSLRGHVEMSVGFNLPPVLALVPEGVIRGVGETVLRQLALQMKQDFDNGLAADFKRYRREKLTEKKTTP
ncbi:uncharacterized protein [Oryza sativa Japonica Group]|uniref:Os03g0168300 protein n=6 Tax=Oryza TaxID=4527 RepID=A0A8J8YMR5_ORYSJ|nr:uncharacterized protein LOC4331753 isoform X1 [Oryza sativa Japonica Group]XP_052145726.1 uncharacterized protein LOC127764984 isoform X2 [Oryza glaberrima]KAB8090385.1 hypothetical protein EE612_015554 [Oryza sativa]ABF94180.1 expressed protein [Oryza sativa Japonica Group]EEE58394.1 hypothetical protein OsJ_09559 [Oryza sativa Japonica Group]KAF2937490.1 hypothetical protein DAI22_03g053700 [Oryza sativa Japonica Group]BAF11003.1 Os03g0168300 [Oryza sativa Japonica Group]|eukprot:NP_001049089.1 Os03g0168300 [Oryza sativa Japonica Group]